MSSAVPSWIDVTPEGIEAYCNQYIPLDHTLYQSLSLEDTLLRFETEWLSKVDPKEEESSNAYQARALGQLEQMATALKMNKESEDTVRCPKCTRPMNYVTKQMRSGDEGMSIIYSCATCNVQKLVR